MLINKRKNQTRVNKVVLAMKKARIRQKISRYRLAHDTGLSESSVAKIEDLKQNPTLSTLIEMAISLNFDLPQALKENFPDTADEREGEEELLTLSPTFHLAVECLKKMDEETLQVIYKVARALNGR